MRERTKGGTEEICTRECLYVFARWLPVKQNICDHTVALGEERDTHTTDRRADKQTGTKRYSSSSCSSQFCTLIHRNWRKCGCVLGLSVEESTARHGLKTVLVCTNTAKNTKHKNQYSSPVQIRTHRVFFFFFFELKQQRLDSISSGR